MNSMKSFLSLVAISVVGTTVSLIACALSSPCPPPTNSVSSQPDPQFEMHSSATVKFLAEPGMEQVWTSDGWLTNCMGKIHVPVPHMHR